MLNPYYNIAEIVMLSSVKDYSFLDLALCPFSCSQYTRFRIYGLKNAWILVAKVFNSIY